VEVSATKKAKSFTCHLAHKVALISDSVALSQAPAEAAGLCTR